MFVECRNPSLPDGQTAVLAVTALPFLDGWEPVNPLPVDDVPTDENPIPASKRAR